MQHIQSWDEPVGWIFADSRNAATGYINPHRHEQGIEVDGISDAIGLQTHTMPFLQKRMQLLGWRPDKAEAIEIVRTTLEEGKKKDSYIIGGRSSILTIDEKGVEWIERGQCEKSSRF